MFEIYKGIKCRRHWEACKYLLCGIDDAKHIGIVEINSVDYLRRGIDSAKYIIRAMHFMMASF